MAYVKQQSKNDCGVAALAMLCDVSYEAAYRAIPWRKKGITFGTDTKMIRAGAAMLGYTGIGTPKHQLKRIKQPPFASIVPGQQWHERPSTADMWRAIPDNSLVKVEAPHGWHWVAWRKGKVYDPARGGAFKPERYVKPVAYMQFVLD